MNEKVKTKSIEFKILHLLLFQSAVVFACRVATRELIWRSLSPILNVFVRMSVLKDVNTPCALIVNLH